MTDKSDPRSQFLFGKAFAAFDAVVQQVPDDAWGNASPCEEWTAADIVGHVAATTQLPCFLAQRVPIGVPAGAFFPLKKAVPGILGTCHL